MLTCSEFANSPNIAIIQHESAVMQVVGHFFENGITSFTTRINSAISFCAANGEVAPFVGHNAFLRWTAIQDASLMKTMVFESVGPSRTFPRISIKPFDCR
jgi:hypothetical protein